MLSTILLFASLRLNLNINNLVASGSRAFGVVFRFGRPPNAMHELHILLQGCMYSLSRRHLG